MSWQSLSTLIAPLQTAGLPLSRAAALRLALAKWGPVAAGDTPHLINIAALAIAMRGVRRSHTLRRAVSRLVHGTDTHALPDAAPRLLCAPCVLEAARPEQGEVLFGDTASLGCYELEGTRYLIGLGYPDGIVVAQWRPQWGEADLTAGLVTASPIVPPDLSASWSAWAREAARYLVLLGALIEAEGAWLGSQTNHWFTLSNV